MFKAVALLSAIISLLAPQARAELVDHTFVKTTLESRFALLHKEVGMSPDAILSRDCDIRVVDGDPMGLRDEASIVVTKNGASLEFPVSPKSSYDSVRGGLIDLTATSKSGLVKHSSLLKISDRQLMLTRLALYPNDADAEPTISIKCQF